MKKILFIPENRMVGTADRAPHLIRILSKRYSLVALSPVSFRKSIPLLRRGAAAIERLYELWEMPHRSLKYRDVDLIFACQSRFALPANIISRRLNKPLIFDSFANPDIYCDSINSGFFTRIRNVYPHKMLRNRVKRLITVSEVDKAAYIKMGFDQRKIEVIPTCIDFNEVDTTPKAEARKILKLPPDKTILLFFTAYDYPPNRDAAEYINRELAPAISDVQIILTGKGSIRESWQTNVDYRGFVDRLGLYIRAADICLAPIWSGAGILEKVLQMMAHGRPTIVTPLAKDGIPELEDGINCIMARDKGGFIEKTRGLVANLDRGQSIGERAKGLIESRYDWSQYEERLFNLVEGI